MQRSRRIITRGVIDMATSAIISSDGYDYAGPMALCDEPGLAAITKSIQEIGELAKAGGIKLDKQLADIAERTEKSDARLLGLEQKILKAGAGAGGMSGNSAALNLGELIAKDQKIEALRKGEVQSARISVPATLKMLIRSILVETGTSGTSPENGFPVPQEFISPTPLAAPGRRLQVLQALPHLPVGTGTAVVPQISSSTDGSAAQEFQGGSKGESSLSVHGVTLPMATVASFINASKQLLDDVATLPNFLQKWIGYFVLRRYESLIVSGSGSAADGHITGLVNGGTAATTNATKDSDKIGQAIFEVLPSYGYAADLIVLNSTDWFNIISERSSSTDQYINPPGWNAAVPNNLWGVRAVSTPALTQGTAVVLDSQLTAILDRTEISYFMGTQGTQLVENLFTYLAEIRGQLAIGDPHSIAVVTL